MHSRVYRSKKVNRGRVSHPSLRNAPIPAAVSSVCGPLPEVPHGVSPGMTNLNANAWDDSCRLVALGGTALLLVLRKRPTPEELERARRQFLVQSGRLVDGMLLDVCEVEAPGNPNQTPPARSLCCSTTTASAVSITSAPRTSPTCPAWSMSPRYGPAFPVQRATSPATPRTVSSWLRTGPACAPVFPFCPHIEDPDPLDLSHLRPGRG